MKHSKESFLKKILNWCDDHEEGLKVVKYLILLFWLTITVETVKIVLAGGSNPFAKILAVISAIGVAISVVSSGIRLATNSNNKNDE